MHKIAQPHALCLREISSAIQAFSPPDHERHLVESRMTMRKGTPESKH